MTSVPRAVLAEAHLVTRLGVRRALERAGVHVVEEAADAAAAVRAVRASQPDVCLLDVRLPGGAIAAAGQIAAAVPAARIVMLSDRGDEDDLLAALRAGATGCLFKDIGPLALGRAVRGTLAGEAPLPRVLTARVIEEVRQLGGERRTRTAEGNWITLSGRESEVLGLMHRQLTTREIAERLGISSVTVRRYVSDTVRRLGVRDRDAALRLTRVYHARGPVRHESPFRS
jgi:two-component system, NarL family, nitrate/nitrite response regulator NarL